jgi:hypothetical protein
MATRSRQQLRDKATLKQDDFTCSASVGVLQQVYEKLTAIVCVSGERESEGYVAISRSCRQKVVFLEGSALNKSVYSGGRALE